MPHMKGRATLCALPYVLKQQSGLEIYRHYTAAALGSFSGMKKSYIDLISDIEKPVDKRTPDEILSDTIKGAEIEVITAE